MLKDFLPKKICDCLYLRITDEDINEIRFRLNCPITIKCNLKTYFLSDNGLCGSPSTALYTTKEMLEDIVFKASEFSMYSVSEQLKQGFITVDGGVRLGVCGEVAPEGNEIKAIKNITSICVRVPHEIKGISKSVFNQIVNDDKVLNTLVISPPGAGKTTLLRDLVYQISYHNYPYNVFIADERGELVGGSKLPFNLGYFYDCLSFVKKSKSMLLGLRSMSPDIVVTDEIGENDDCDAILKLMTCGVSVIASVHADSIEDLRKKPALLELIDGKYFDRFIVLSKRDGVGTIEGVYRGDFSKIYGGTIWKPFYLLVLLHFLQALDLVWLVVTMSAKDFSLIC